MSGNESGTNTQRAVFSVRSAESPNGGAKIPGAAADGRRLAEQARAWTLSTRSRGRYGKD